MSSFIVEDTSEEPPKALRLIFECEGDDHIELIYQAVVDTIAHKFHATEGREGHFVDTYDKDDNLISRFYAYGAFQKHTEVFTPSGMKHAPVEGKVVFSLLVPYNDTVDHVRITHVGPEQPRMPDIETALFSSPRREREIGRFKIDIGDK